MIRVTVLINKIHKILPANDPLRTLNIIIIAQKFEIFKHKKQSQENRCIRAKNIHMSQRN